MTVQSQKRYGTGFEKCGGRNVMGVVNIFDMLHPPIKLKPPIRMFEAFSGVGTQAMALKRITNDYEIVGYSEIDKYAIQSYHAIHGDVKPYGDITKMKEIPPCDIFTWSFPCTDLSKAGKRKGMNGNTRSGLVYEVLRLVRDTKDKPKVLIMENVPDLIQEKFVRQFSEIQLELESYGYMNYVEVLNAKDFGVAQNRNRVFMVSVLGEYSYSFPRYKFLDKRLKDYLEDEVDEKYYLNENFIDQMIKEVVNYNRKDKFIDGLTDGNKVSRTIATKLDRPESNYVLEPYIIDTHSSDRFKRQPQSKISPTIITDGRFKVVEPYIAIPEATTKGYAEAHDGDGVYINRPHQKRGVVQKGMIQTIKTSGNDIGIVEKVKTIVANLQSKNYIQVIDGKTYIVGSDGVTLFRIRKLTPREALRLMDVSETDIDIILSQVSDTQAYKLAGNSIVVNVLVEIFRKLF